MKKGVLARADDPETWRQLHVLTGVFPRATKVGVKLARRKATLHRQNAV